MRAELEFERFIARTDPARAQLTSEELDVRALFCLGLVVIYVL